jgi:hypothetical protein
MPKQNPDDNRRGFNGTDPKINFISTAFLV